MKLKILYSLLTVIFVFISCSSPTDPMESKVWIKPTDSELKIFNGTDRTIYTFIVEREYSALINWAPNFSGSGLLPNSSTFVDYSKIGNGSTDAVKSGDEIVVHYWDESNKSKPKIYSQLVRL